MANKFHHLMKALRKQKDWSMAVLAEKTELSDAYISLIESNKRQPSHKAALKLAQVLSNSEDEILAFMTAAGYPNLEAVQPLVIAEIPFNDFIQKVLSKIRHQNYRVAESLISEGLKNFQDTVQIQMLVAHLELARQHPHLAIIAMNTALTARQTYPGSQVDLIDIYLNLGICHFIQGSHWSQQDNTTEAIKAYQQAIHFFEKVLLEYPEHLYCLDEYARCIYNLAHLGEYPWKKVVSAYEKVMAGRCLLSDQVKREVLSFSALAYTRSGKPALAEILFLRLLFIAFEALTVHAYLCHCCYAHAQTQHPRWLKQARAMLINVEKEFPDYMSTLISDPELALLFKKSAVQ